MMEHHHYIRLYHPEKSVVAKHSVNLGLHIQFYYTSILAKKSRCMEHIVRKAIEIELHFYNINRDEGFSQSK
jgi:hypothetical protein